MTNPLYAKCECHSVNFLLPNKPTEICDCYCTICKDLHLTKFTSFAKYPFDKYQFRLNSKSLQKINSIRASRYFCMNCKKFIFMYYHNSPNIWFYMNTFDFDISNVEHYAIYDK